MGLRAPLVPITEAPRIPRFGARIVYLYLVIAERIYLVRCSGKNVQTDLTADEKKQLRQITACLEGAH